MSWFKKKTAEEIVEEKKQLEIKERLKYSSQVIKHWETYLKLTNNESKEKERLDNELK